MTTHCVQFFVVIFRLRFEIIIVWLGYFKCALGKKRKKKGVNITW